MGFKDERFRTIACDNPGCDKTIRFELSDVKTIQATEWLKGVRIVKTGDGRDLTYCSDVCEVKGVTTGAHNLKEPPKVEPAGLGDIKAAVAAAENAAAVEQAMKTGLSQAMKTGEGEARITLS